MTAEAGCSCGWHGDADAADDHPCTLPDPTSPTLVEFLLARIAEDKERIRYREPTGKSWHEARCGYAMGEHGTDCICDVPARVLAECDAKRQIIDMCRDLDQDFYSPDAGSIADSVLELLTLPYADHPDYQQKWR